MTYEELCSFEVLYKAYLEARKGKRSKSKTIEYEAQALACTEKLSRKLAVCNVRQPDGSIRQQIRYVPSKFEVFAVYEPKRRMVHAPAFVDKVVLHALVDNILYDALTKSFIRDSHASQTGKGTDDGLMRLKTHMVDYYRRRPGCTRPSRASGFPEADALPMPEHIRVFFQPAAAPPSQSRCGRCRALHEGCRTTQLHSRSRAGTPR